MNLLEVQDLKVSYGGIRALKGISLNIAAGELVALIGSNGAGKSTTLKALAGLLPCQGKLHLQGKSLLHRAGHLRVADGMALVPEGRGVFARLSVQENLQIGAYTRKETAAILEQELQQIYALFPRLKERRNQLAGTLSGGEQQMLAMGRAMMCKPRLLMLDEPSMGLAPLMVEKVFETIQNISTQGVSILLVEQNARQALQIASRGYVLESGSITLSDDAASLLDSAAIQKAYLGS